MNKNPKCIRFLKNLTGLSLKNLIIRAGFPYHKAPHLYEWIWVFIMLPFLEEDTLNELSEKYGNKLRSIYRLLRTYPEAFEKLLRLMSTPFFCEIMREYEVADETGKSRLRVRIIIDDTNAEKFGKNMEFIHKLFDHSEGRYIMGYNYVLVIVASGDTVLPLSFVLWLPKTHAAHRSRNDIAVDEIMKLKSVCDKNDNDMKEVEIMFDSAYCVGKVINAVEKTGARLITKVARHKFQVGEELLTIREIIENNMNNQWNYLESNHYYQRICAHHHVYGEVILTVRRRELKNGKIVHDVLMCNKKFYNSVRIHKGYKKRWEIEMQFKYYKQYLYLGKYQFEKLGSIVSSLMCVSG